MPRFSYKAQVSHGERLDGTAEAASLPALADALAKQGARIESAREVAARAPRIRGVPYFEITGVYRQVASSLEAGLPLVETLEMLASESGTPGMKSLLYYLKTQISRGVPLSDAMRLVPGIFPKVHIAAVRAGEESGQLEPVLADLADQAETLSNMNRKFASSLVYPTVISFVALGLFVFAFTIIVPRFQAMFGDLGIMEFPALTKLVLFIGGKVMPVVVLLALGVTFLGLVILTQRRAASGRLWLDAWKLRLPVVGQIVEKASLARFSGTLGVLLESGIDVPRAVRIASEGAGNRVVEHLIKNVSAEVELGHSLGESISRIGSMPPTLAWRVSVGEETGTLPDALMRMSRLYAEQVDALVTSLAGLLEPVFILVIGGGVAALVVGLFLPLVAVIQNLSGG